MYADDTTILVSARNEAALFEKIKCVTTQLSYWCGANRLIINHHKTVFTQFTGQYKKTAVQVTLDNLHINSANAVLFLGCQVDNKLCWSPHINEICKKLNKAYFALLTLRRSLSQDALLTYYYSYVYPTISYNIISWEQATKWPRVFILQKRIIRLIYDLKPTESCRDTFMKHSLLTVVGIYLFKVLLYMKQNLTSFRSHCDNHDYHTRNMRNLYDDNHAYMFYKKSPKYAGIHYFNMLPDSLKNADATPIFKKKLKSILTQKCFYIHSEGTNFTL
nr:unnamed protein product [Callosobruchus analis]